MTDLQAVEMQVGQFTSTKKGDVSYSLSYTYGQEALDSYSRLKQEFLPVSTESVGLGTESVELNFYEIEKEKLEKKHNLLASAKKILLEEYHDKSPKAKMARHLTFLVTSGSSVYIWQASGYLPYQEFMGASLSVAINALFIYFEDHFDMKVYMNRYSKSFAKRVSKTIELYKKRLGIRNFSYGQEKSQISEVAYKASSVESRVSAWSVKSLFKKNSENPKAFEDFLTRFFTTSGINFALIGVYEMIKYGLPGGSFLEVSDFLVEVTAKLGTVVLVGMSYSLTRGALKDLRAEALVSPKFVTYFSAISRVALSASYVLLFTEAISKTALITYVGAPGWAVAALMLTGVHKPALLAWRERNKNAEKKSSQRISSYSPENWSEKWKSSDYRYLQVRMSWCKDVFPGGK